MSKVIEPLHLFAPQGQATRAEGVVECASTRDPDALPQAPTPKSLSKSGFALSPGRRFLHIIALRIGVTLDLLVGVEKAEQEIIRV